MALQGPAARTALDLGTGSGIAALLLAARGIAATGIDVRPEWAEGWARSVAESAASADLRVADVRAWRGERVDLVVSNPPFFAVRSGPAAADPWKAAARTEGEATLADFVTAATHLGGRACFVVPVERGEEVAAAAALAGWHAARRVQVGRRRALLDLRPGEGAAVVERVGEDDPQVAAWYALARSTPPRGAG